MRAKKLNERLNDDDARTISGWLKAFHGDPDFNKTIKVLEPFEITFDREDDYHKLAFLLQKYRIPFEELEAVSEGTLKFSDGVEFNTDGPLRPEKRRDGWYVVGRGMLIPVDSKEEALKYIESQESSGEEFKKYVATGKPQGRATKAWDKYLKK